MSETAPEPLQGATLWITGFALALANFVVVLDITITAVAVPHIAGSLAVSPSQGTWTITSYAVAEAVSVPLTGWLAMRFGTVRWFMISLFGFGFFSMWCGFSQTLGFLVAGRVFQGLLGGPMMPLTQSLLIRIFPPEKQPIALGLWAITTVCAPVIGPIVGGQISDNWSWPWIFFINLPVIAFSLFMVSRNLVLFETPRVKTPIDIVGLLLLITWVGAFQIMLDTGQEHGWFESGQVVMMAVIAAIAFVAFLIWEWTEAHPMVDVRMIKNTGFALATLAMSITYGAFIGLIVLVPIWLQQTMGYSATLAGNTMAFMGVLAIVAAPLSAIAMTKIDVRITISAAIIWMAVVSLMRAGWSTDSTFWGLAVPQFLQGFAIPFYFMGSTALALGTVQANQITSAAGLMSFVRTLVGAVATALITANWIDMTRGTRAEIVPSLNGGADTIAAMQARGMTMEQARAMIDRMVEVQANTVAMTHIFLWLATLFALSAALVWLVPKLKGPVAMGGGH